MCLGISGWVPAQGRDDIAGGAVRRTQKCSALGSGPRVTGGGWGRPLPVSPIKGKVKRASLRVPAAFGSDPATSLR